MSKHVVKLFISVILTLSLVLSGCGSANDSSSGNAGSATQTSTPSVRTVKDSDGKTVEIPSKVERVAPTIGAMAQMTALLGGAGKTVAGITVSDNFTKVFPDYLKANPKQLEPGNVEDVIGAKAQVVFGPVTDAAMIAQYEAAGIKVVKLANFSSVDDIMDSISTIADILGGDAPAKAKEFNAYFQKNLDDVKAATSDIPEDQRVKMMYLSVNGGNLGTINKTDICSTYIAAAGGINVADGLESDSSISAENVVELSPQIIFTMTPENKKAILGDATLQNVPAVKNNKVYVVPKGLYYWNVRSAEGALMPLWLGKIMYPDRFAKLDLADAVRYYFKNFYNYTVSDSEIETILQTAEQPK
ncbi:ABC transporter substrate-binding protein [Paenibacillus peoriae]|uniref:ABC transporter substrate-binding protein n=1 Tax=Paenibacillus peoriae TaxID=59893 RepID=UPI00026C5E96|nr:ABC transporter substrate-binding protein [Paenibacillus peoriae]MEC0181968.1 ABC transporter substrate-binding protein [Paenibacillus peoriae]